jgi:hypothetical protein
MTNQLPHQNFFPDLSKLTLCPVLKTDQGSWKARVSLPSHERAIDAGILAA